MQLAECTPDRSSARRKARSPARALGVLAILLSSCLGAASAQEPGQPASASGDAVKKLNESRLVDLRSQVDRLATDLASTRAGLVAVISTQTVLKARLEASVALVTSTSAALEASSDDALRELYKGQLKESEAAKAAAEEALSQALAKEKELSERAESLQRKLTSSQEGLESQAHWLGTRFRPELPQEELRAFLRPLTRAELEVEASAWIRLVQQKVAGISANELWLATNKADPGHSTKDLDERMQSLVLLQDDRAKLVDRARLVLSEQRLKGAEDSALAENEDYLKAVSGLQIDTSDSRSVALGLWNWVKAEEGGLR